MHTLKQTGDWLRNNHIHVNDDWLKACVEWIQEENQGQGLTNNDINSQVYEQWLLADLHELETCCLPGEITTSQKYQLTGFYALQIDSILDVGVSLYSQQQKLKGTENANVHVNAEEPTQKPWEAKPTRMLMFKLTDGTHNVQGMEYRPISCLSPQTAPGAKILVHGNVLCRHNVLMLSDSNIKFLGGEVDTLVESNTVLNTLQSAMTENEEYAGKEHKQTYAGTPVRHCKQQIASNQSNQGNQSRSWGNARATGTQFSQKGQTDSKPFKQMKSEPVTQSSYTAEMSDYDMLLDDDMDSIMQEMTDDDFEPTGNLQNRNSNSRNVSNTKLTTNNPLNGSRQISLGHNNLINTSNGPNNVGLESRGQMRSSSGSTNQKPTFGASAVSVLTNDDLDAMDFEDDMDFPPEDLITSTNNQPTYQNLNKTSASIGNSNIKHFGADIEVKHQNSNFNSQMNPNGQVKNNKFDNSKSSITLMNGSRQAVLNNVDMTVNISNKGVNLSITSRNPNPKSGAANRTGATNQTAGAANLAAGATNLATSAANRRSATNQANEMTVPASKLCLSKVKSESDRKIGGANSLPLGGQPHLSSIQTFFTPNKEEIVQPEKEGIGTDIQTEYPFTYLRKVMSLPVKTEPSYHTVKAYISTLTSKLSSSGEKWTLSCKINDGTMAVDVDLSNNVLTEMIGFSWKEAQKMRQRLKTDPGVKEVLTEGIQQCQQKLIELMCLLELEICAKNPRPVIVATKQLTSHHIDMLYNRVMANWDSKS